LRMIYTADCIRAQAGRSTEPIRGTYRASYPSATPRSSPPASLPLPIRARAHTCAYVRVNTHHHKIFQRTALRQTAPRRQHNAANTKTPIRSEPKLLCREPRTPAGTHAFFAHDHPARIYGSVSSSSPHLLLIVIIRMNKDRLFTLYLRKSDS